MSDSAGKKPRRSSEEIAEAKRVRLERSIERSKQQVDARINRRVSPAEGHSSNAEYDLELEAKRQSARDFQEGGIDFINDRDTPLARAFAAEVVRREDALKASQRSRAESTDPLNLMGSRPKPSAAQVKADSRKAEEARLARGERRQIIHSEDGEKADVVTLPHSLRRAKIATHHIPAAEKLVRDWEIAGYTGLRSKAFGDKVDGSSAHAGHHVALEAQRRLIEIQKYIGQRNYDIVVGVAIIGTTPSGIHAAGGRDHRSVRSDIDVAFNALVEFYDPDRLARDPTWRAFRRAIEQAQMIIASGEAEVR